MIIENFYVERISDLYKKFDNEGRLLPVGVQYIDSWVSDDLKTCFQIMESPSRHLIDLWIEEWKEFADFEVIPIISSNTAKNRILSS